MKVRNNGWYLYDPDAWDKLDPKTDLAWGQRVQVRNLHGAPPCNTMGCAHVYDEQGKFRGLVSTGSLFKTLPPRNA